MILALTFTVHFVGTVFGTIDASVAFLRKRNARAVVALPFPGGAGFWFGLK